MVRRLANLKLSRCQLGSSALQSCQGVLEVALWWMKFLSGREGSEPERLKERTITWDEGPEHNAQVGKGGGTKSRGIGGTLLSPRSWHCVWTWYRCFPDLTFRPL